MIYIFIQIYFKYICSRPTPHPPFTSTSDNKTLIIFKAASFFFFFFGKTRMHKAKASSASAPEGFQGKKKKKN